jgi:Na+/melibiose symporter-like transporter
MPPNNITKIIIINFCQRFHLYIHAYALLLQSRGLSLLQISTIESVVIGTIFLMEVPTGVIADRIGRKWSIVASTFCLMCAESIFIFARSYHWYLLIALLTGTGFAFASGAVDALVYDSLPEENRDNEMKRVMGRVGSAGQIAFFIAPIIGAFIIGDATPERFILAIVLTVAALFIGLMVSLTLQEPATDWQADKPNALTIFREGLSELRGSPQLRQLVLLIMFTSAFTGTLITTFAAPHLIQQGAVPFMTGIALSVGSLIAAFTQRYAYKIEAILGKKWGLTLLILLPGVMYCILALVTGAVPTLLVIIFMYGTNDMKAPLFSAYQNALIGSRNRATVLSIMSMMISLFVAVVAPIYATIAGYSLSLAFAIIGIVIITAGLILRVYRAPVEQVA